MIPVSLVGYAAGVLTPLALLPEIYRTWKTKDAKDLSYYWLGSLTIGNTLWAIYGFLISSLPLLISNSVSIALGIVLILLTIKYNTKKRRR